MRTRDELRADIDVIDSQLLELLNRRVELAIEIARLKPRDGVPHVDRQRERTVINRACAANAGPMHRRSVTRVFRVVIRESRIAQARSVK